MDWHTGGKWLIRFIHNTTWWRHQMETFYALLALCVGNSSVTGEFPSQRPVTRSFNVFFDLRLNKQLSKHLRRWWFETPSQSLWRHYNETLHICSTARTICSLQSLELPCRIFIIQIHICIIWNSNREKEKMRIWSPFFFFLFST